MGLGAAWDKLMQGHPGDAFSYLYVSDAEIATDKATDAKLGTLNAQTYGNPDSVLYDPQAYAAAQGHLQGGNIDAQLTDPATSPLGGFQQSIQDTANNTASGIQGVTSFGLGSIFKLIPWQVWILGIGYLLFITSAIWMPFAKKALKGKLA